MRSGVTHASEPPGDTHTGASVEGKPGCFIEQSQSKRETRGSGSQMYPLKVGESRSEGEPELSFARHPVVNDSSASPLVAFLRI